MKRFYLQLTNTHDRYDQEFEKEGWKNIAEADAMIDLLPMLLTNLNNYDGQMNGFFRIRDNAIHTIYNY